ncbi:HD-GYP domain, c-di-GMP phosphodiesterase class II (or its inactivated variant) [Ruminococcus sp. YE71]|uniref:HD-GYP domain-containing protein n=1 Tax=unclassified Ruminococcus TaxID=2608920 RepID=UPI000880797A|nr:MULTISPECIES: HD-GYP domain-containing protein [unclassified Ruminococcus]SDA18214.1 HD-GYP domain, c-di-GMP phosphodiesterase class II (or its inactivated variant) [Ruminococcus sp. YE78]SFW30280.1 HD-GYP domain, c-di-GMP phosphodiesterase class II (or its inactivated variant) [Ruminococcus sp. YE71]
MEESKQKVIKICRRLAKLLKVISVAIYILIVLLVVAIIFAPHYADTLNISADIEDMPGTMQFLQGVSDGAKFSKLTKIIISETFMLLSLCVYQFFVHIMIKMLEVVSMGDSPFTKKTAVKLRKASWYSIIILFMSSATSAVITFITLRLFAAIFEYGAYLQEKADETNRIQEEMIVSFAEITENKSSQTGNHVKRVSEYSRIIAEQMGLSEEECERIRLASTMHDIGKLMIPTEILEKPARLTDEEFAEIKKHSGYGGELLDHVEGDIMQLAKQIALDHHERPDGRGYPTGKLKDSISIEGRIVAVADVYDALTSKRSYKEPWDPEVAYNEIVKNAGSQFDEEVINAFKEAYPKIDEARSNYADGKDLSFIKQKSAT